MKKKVLMLLSIVLLSGCTAEYNLEFKDDVFYEVIEGTVNNDEIEEEVEGRTDVNPIYYNLYIEDNPLISSSEEVYNKQIIDIENGKKFNFSYAYDGNFDKAKVINYCFEENIFEEDDEFYYINLSGKFGCLYSDELKINVTSDKAVLENNADSIKNNTYSWTINEDNVDDVNIMMAISKSISSKDNEYKVEISTFKIVAFVILIVLSIITYFLYRKKNSDNL